MSERDSVHKEIEKLQEEIKEKNKKLASHEGLNKHYDDAIKEINQAITVRIRASKDIKRLTEERNAAMQVREYHMKNENLVKMHGK